MSLNWIILARLNAQGAQNIAEHNMKAERDAFAAALAKPPANGTITSWYAVDSHDWDVAIIGHVDNDDPAYWAKVQLQGRATGTFEQSMLLRLASPDDFDAVELT